MIRIDSLLSYFKAYNQEHIFEYWHTLNAQQQEHLYYQASSINLEDLQFFKDNKQSSLNYSDIYPAQTVAHLAEDSDTVSQATLLGKEALKQSRVAAFTVAGGQSTRLGVTVPKGTLEVTPVKHKPLFQIFAEKIIASQKRYNSIIPWFIMTSPVNHEKTLSFFKNNHFFGLQHVFFFPQKLLPAVDFSQKIILENPYTIAMNPDGHGGAIKAFVASRSLEKMESLGCDIISYFQVDNPIVQCIDPTFIGLHLHHGSDMSSKVIPKTKPEEKVGVFCKINNKLQVIEYSDLTQDLAQKKEPNGNLSYRLANIAVHTLSLPFIKKISHSNHYLPYHLAKKQISYYDPTTQSTITPTEPNGIKLETFIFDALPFANNPILVETTRSEEFSPIKNAAGQDSLTTATVHQIALFKSWLQAANIHLDDSQLKPDYPIEISPLFADTKKQFVSRWLELKNPPPITPNTYIDNCL